MLLSLRDKAKKIWSRSVTSDNQPSAAADQPVAETKPMVIAPHSPLNETVQKLIGPALGIVSVGGQKIGGIMRKKRKQSRNRDSVVYKIPCGGCPRVYYGETGRGLKTRVREHRGDLRNHRLSNAFVIHAEKEGHLPDWTRATHVDQNFSKTQRRIIEAAFIAKGDVLNTSSGFFRLASVSALLARKDVNL